MSDNRKFEVGDKVYCPLFGYGVVKLIKKIVDKGDFYPIEVMFSNDTNDIQRFSDDGLYFVGSDLDNTPVLFHDNLPVLFHDKPKEWPNPKKKLNLKKDDKVLVRNHSNAYWVKRYFHKWNDNGDIVTFPNGVTSWSNDGGWHAVSSCVGGCETGWNYWKLPDDEEETNE